MRLASYVVEARSTYGVVVEGGIIDLGRRMGPGVPDLATYIALGADPGHAAGVGPDHAIDEIDWAPVVPNPSQILCVGLNYRAHVEEVGRPLGQFPTIFLRVAASLTAHRQPIIRPRVSDQLDFEGELAVVIGRPGRHIAEAEALAHVAGYAPYNDASVRDWQRHSGQYTAGKNFPSTGAFGPWLVTADEIADPAALEVTTRLDGRVVQHAPLSELVFPIPRLISYLSAFTALRPGDVIVTGTPAGVGSMRVPPLWMAPGDTVEVEVAGVATLVNPVVAED